MGPYRLKKALIDPGSMRTLVSEEFVNKHSIPMQMRSHIRIELANGQIEVPVGELLEPQRIEIAGILATLDLPVVQSRGVYDLLLGRNWLRVLGDQGIMVLAPLTVFPGMEGRLYCGIHGMGVF